MPDPLVLECGGGSFTLQSIYFGVWLAIANIDITVDPDPPPCLQTILSGLSCYLTLIANWGSVPSIPTSSEGVWGGATTYFIGDSVNYGEGVYMCVREPNAGHTPDAMDGWWTQIDQPPVFRGQIMTSRLFGYLLKPPYPDDLSGVSYQAGLGQTTAAWTGTPPGDIDDFGGVFLKFNFSNGDSKTSMPWGSDVTTGSMGKINSPGPYAEFQCWHTGGLASMPLLTLYNWLPDFLDALKADLIAGESAEWHLAASGGTPPYTFKIIKGRLPEGMTLDESTGIISGTPTAPGTESFTAQVTDATGQTATVTCGFEVGCSNVGALNAFY